MSAGAEELTEAVEFALAKWGDLRQHNKARAADAHFHTWLFETIPADFEILRGQPGHDPDSAHAFLAFEIVSALFERDRPADAFLVLGWLGKYFVNHPNADAATRAVMALTDHCTQAGTAGPENNASARRVLRDVVDAARRQLDIRVERALCRALVGIANLRGFSTAPEDASRRAEELSALWTEVITRWRHSTDPHLRDWVSHALTNKAFLWLQYGREDIAREQFSTIVELFGDNPPEAHHEAYERLISARHASAILDRFALGEPEFKLDYLERQRYWDKRARRKGFGIPWLLAGAPRNHLPDVVRHARERHRSSTGKLQSWLCGGEPFSRGWFVAGEVTTATSAAHVEGFADYARKHRIPTTTEVLLSRVRPCTVKEAQRLRITPGEDLFEMRRLRSLNGMVVVLEHNRLPLAVCPALADTDFTYVSLYATLLTADPPQIPRRAEYAVEARPPNREERRALELEGTAVPVLMARQFTYSQHGHPLELSDQAYLGRPSPPTRVSNGSVVPGVTAHRRVPGWTRSSLTSK